MADSKGGGLSAATTVPDAPFYLLRMYLASMAVLNGQPVLPGINGLG